RTSARCAPCPATSRTPRPRSRRAACGTGSGCSSGHLHLRDVEVDGTALGEGELHVAVEVAGDLLALLTRLSAVSPRAVRAATPLGPHDDRVHDVAAERRLAGQDDDVLVVADGLHGPPARVVEEL